MFYMLSDPWHHCLKNWVVVTILLVTSPCLFGAYGFTWELIESPVGLIQMLKDALCVGSEGA